MQIFFDVFVTFSIILEFIVCIDAWCNATKDQKHYMCVGKRNYYGFGSLSVNVDTRSKITKATFLNCQEENISEEVFDFPSLKHLMVSCDVQSIHENAFKNLNGLQELDLGNNLISSLPDAVFNTLGNLRKLNLSDNKFETLSRNMFNGLNGLKQLYLSYNSISKFDIKSLDPTRSIEELHLDNNKINVIPSRVFNKLSNLLAVDLSYNKIEDLGRIFTSTFSLEKVNLSHNAIEELPTQLFKFSNLEILDVSYNLLSIIYEDALKLDTLKELYLQHNQLSQFEVKGVSLIRLPLRLLDLRFNKLVFVEEDFIKLAKNLLTFKVEGNPWDCNCFERMELLHGDLILELSSPYENGEEPLCVLSISNDNVCNIKKDDLFRYYDVFIDQLGPR